MTWCHNIFPSLLEPVAVCGSGKEPVRIGNPPLRETTSKTPDLCFAYLIIIKQGDTGA